PPDRRLPTSGLADQPERLATLDRQRDAVDGLDVSDVPVENDPALDREVDLEIVYVDEAARATVASRVRSHSSSGTGLKHATEWSRSISRSGGTWSRESGTSYEQRGANGHAVGAFVRCG